jgi:WD40 repeat protein
MVRNQVYISYARKDAAELAHRLTVDLTQAGFTVWIDSQSLREGTVWSLYIEKAIDESDVVLALMTPGSYVSETCRAEQLRALRMGKRVAPILGSLGSDIPLHLSHLQYFDFTDAANYSKNLYALRGYIATGGGNPPLPEGLRNTRTTYITAPPIVANYIDRPEAIRELRDTLFAEAQHGGIGLTALEGMGGVGKTVLAQALFRDEAVQQAFPDGLVWITLGREPTYELTAGLREIVRALGGATYGDVQAEAAYRTTIAKKAALIVIDDVWRKEDLEPFLADSRRSKILFTTRDASIARSAGAREYKVSLLNAAEGRELLAHWAGVDTAQLPPAADDILRECDMLPMALSTVGALLRDAAAPDWNDTLALLRNADLTAIERELPAGSTSFFRAIDVSVNSLPPEMRQLYAILAVLLDDIPATLQMLETLWNLDEPEVQRVSRRLTDRSLAQIDEKTGGLYLHHLQLEYLRSRFPDRESLRLIQGAVRLSLHIIEKDPNQFAAQLVGRLASFKQPTIRALMRQAASKLRVGWLQDLKGDWTTPGGPLVQSVEAHERPANAVIILRDGRRAVSASDDRTLKLWDLETGRALRTLTGHSDSVSGVAATPDGTRAVSASRDSTLKVWDLTTGSELMTLQGHAAAVTGVAETGAGRLAVSASQDRTVKVWDLETGRAISSLEGHSDFVTCVAATADGKRAVSASLDNTLIAWDLTTGRSLRTLKEHSASVTGVAVTLDGRRAISASLDRTVKVWDLQGGYLLRSLEGHADGVTGVAVTSDGRRAVSASLDKTVRVWDLETGAMLLTLTGHSDRALSVAIAPDGERAISSCADGTLKLWSLRNPTASQEDALVSLFGLLTSPEALATELARVAMTDRSRLQVLESPDTLAVREMLTTWMIQQSSTEEASVNGPVTFQPNALWLAWMVHIQGPRLEQISRELRGPAADYRTVRPAENAKPTPAPHTILTAPISTGPDLRIGPREVKGRATKAQKPRKKK